MNSHLLTYTSIDKQIDNSILIKTSYLKTPPNIFEVVIEENVGNYNSVNYEEEELVILYDSLYINAYININGELIIIGNEEEINNYELDNNGDLVYEN